MADTLENGEELPELEGVAMEPAEQPAPDTAAPVAPSESFSAKDLTDDILGGVDFDLPAPPPSMSAPKPMPAPKPPVTGGFKPPGALFGQSGGFGASGLKPAPVRASPPTLAPAPVLAPAPEAKAPEPAMFDAAELAGPAPDAQEALRAALTSDTAPAALPPDAARAIFQLARVLIKKGIVTVDELI